MFEKLTHRRTDGTFVAVVRGHPYHIIAGDPMFAGAATAAEAMGNDLPFEAPPPPPAPPSMPSITAAQLRLALLGMGITAATVEAAIGAMPGTDTDREAARIQWEYATTFQRQHPLVVGIGAALGLTESQIDAAWLHAATL